MTKKHFVALAEAIRNHNENMERAFGRNSSRMKFHIEQTRVIADFCQSQNAQFDRDRFLVACGVK